MSCDHPDYYEQNCTEMYRYVMIQRGTFDSTVGTDVYLSGVFFTDTSVCGSFKQQIGQICFTKVFLHHNGWIQLYKITHVGFFEK